MDQKMLSTKILHFLYDIKLSEALSEDVLFHSGCY